MIFVTLGTQDKEFTRLLQMVENLIDKKVIKEEVVAQIGLTNYSSNKMKLVKFMTKEEMQDNIKNAKYIITHGGVGTILDALSLDKKVIAVARLSKYKEHHNDHQLEIVSEFRDLGYILDGTYNLEAPIKLIKNFKPKKYKSNNEKFVKLITDYIDNK